jgi:hypothetical protein
MPACASHADRSEPLSSRCVAKECRNVWEAETVSATVRDDCFEAFVLSFVFCFLKTVTGRLHRSD